MYPDKEKKKHLRDRECGEISDNFNCFLWVEKYFKVKYLSGVGRKDFQYYNYAL